jgi:hypothetical protein
MSSQTQNTWSAASALAGISDARQVRAVDASVLNLVNYDTLPFCSLLGGQEAFEKDGGYYMRPVAGKIKSVGIQALKPELYDFEVAPNSFRLTADTVAVSNGDSVNLTLNSTAGLAGGAILKKVDQNIVLRVTSPTSSNVVACKVVSGADATIITKNDNIAYFVKVGTATADGSTVNNGATQEPKNQWNYLQFHLKTYSQGLVQGNLNLYGNAGMTNMEVLKRNTGYDFQRDRESAMVLGNRASEGTAGGSDYITYSGGLTYLGESVYQNSAGDGTLTEDEFMRGLMPAMRQGGDSAEVYALCGTDVMTVLSGFSRVKLQTQNGDDKYSSFIRTYETPSGILKVVPHALLNQEAYRGTMIGFQPKLLTRYFLKNMDVQHRENFDVGNVLRSVSGYMAVEGILASNPKAITIATNILK